VRVDLAGQVVVDETIGVRALPSPASERLLPSRERAIEADRDTDQTDCNRSQVREDKSMPSEGEHSADRDEHEVGEMRDNDRISEPDEHGPATVA